jgi:hypothetical protein
MNIHENLAAIQSALKAPKSQYNSFGGYHYRNAEDILEAVKPLLAQQGCVLTCTDEIVLIGERYYVKATATICNKEGQIVQTSAYAREEESKKGMDGSQVTGASSSYARKYALNGLFCIDDTKDSDTTNTGDQKPQPEKKPAPKKKVATAPAPEAKPIGVRERWIAALAHNAVNEQGVTAQDAYFAKFNPSPDEWALIQDEVYHYKKDHNIQ